MSYIRCLSNPEGLYIWGDFQGRANFCLSTDPKIYQIPLWIFHGILKRYAEGYSNSYKFRGAKLHEIQGKLGKNFDQSVKNAWKWRLSYKDWHIDMYEVTLFYIAHSRVFRWKKDSK